MKTDTKNIGRARTVCLCIALGSLALSPGCYTKVIDAKGIGADQKHPKQSEATKPLRARDLWSNDEDGN